MMRGGGAIGLGGGRGFGGSMRSLTQDRSVITSQVPKGTARRILRCLAPYKGKLAFFFGLTIVDSSIGVAVPLIYRAIIDTGIGHRDVRLIVILALVIGGLAVVDAGLSLGEQLCSSQVGQGLIYDLRTRVYAHVQKMSLAFFTRTQTGALVSRLNNDVLGAQQATTDILSSVIGNLLSIIMVLTTMLILSWQITLVALALLPAFAIPARYMGRRLGAITREGYVLAADMNSTMAERFNVAGALLVKLFGRPGEEEQLFSGRAGRVRDIAVLQAIYARVFFISLTVTAALATALVYGWGGSMVVHGVLELGTLVAMTAYLSRLYGPLTQLSNVNVDVMTALVSFDRVFEVLDLAADDHGTTRCALARTRPLDDRVRPCRFQLPDRERRVPRVARVGRRPRDDRGPPGPPRRNVPAPSPASSSRSSGRPVPARRRSRTSSRACTT